MKSMLVEMKIVSASYLWLLLVAMQTELRAFTKLQAYRTNKCKLTQKLSPQLFTATFHFTNVQQMQHFLFDSHFPPFSLRNPKKISTRVKSKSIFFFSPLFSIRAKLFFV
jgi:hypothetical protein